MSFPKYPAYKDSGVEWIKVVPTHWSIMPMYSVVEECDEPNLGMKENNLLSLSYGHIVNKDINSNDGLLPESFETYQVVEPNDIVLRLTDLQNDQRSLRSAIVKERGIITSAYLAVRPRAITPSYLAHLMRAYDLTKVFYSMGGGLRQSMKFADLKRMPVLVPPAEEQVRIAGLLNRETAKIDALVAEQENLITLLKEKRQAVISHAVTKGLDPSVPMKDSGIEWLGEVPAHWEVWKISHAFDSIGSGTTPPSSENNWYEDGKVPWVTTGELRECVITETSKSVTQAALEKFTSLRVHKSGSLVIALYGATIGRLGILGVDATTNQACCVLGRPKSVTVPFMFFWLQAFKEQIINIYAFGGGQPNISQEVIANLRVPAPSLLEQKRIYAYLEAETVMFDRLLSDVTVQIALLQERRSALISAAVTGQIDVRGLTSQEPA